MGGFDLSMDFVTLLAVLLAWSVIMDLMRG
jgi:hypothetical protein